MDRKEPPRAEGWTSATIAVLAEPKGIAYGVLKPGAPTPAGVPMLRVSDLHDGRINEADVYLISKSLDAEYRRTKLRGGEVLVSIQGTVGRVAIVPKALAGSNLSRTLAMIRLQDPELAPWVRRALESPQLQQAMRDAVTGTTRDSLNLRDLRQIRIPIAPPGDRPRLLQTLAEFDELALGVTTHLAHANTAIKDFRQSVLAAACSGRLTEVWRHEHTDVEPSSVALERKRLADRDRLGANYREPKLPHTARLPDIPATWCWAALPELGDLGRGKSKHRPRNDPSLFGGAYPFIQTGDVASSDGLITSYSQTYNDVGLAQSKLWPTSTVCITIAANIAESALLTFPACFPDSIVGLVAHKDVAMAEYVELFMRTARRDLAAFAPATAQSNINLAILSELAVAVPPVEEQREIIRIVGEAYARCSPIEAATRKTTQYLGQIAHAVTTQAFRGDLLQTRKLVSDATALTNGGVSSGSETAACP